MDGNKINTGIFVPPMNAAELVRYLKIVQKINENVKERIVPLIIGHTGVGKSQIIEQISNELNIDFVPLYLSQMDVSDFTGLQTVVDGFSDYCQPAYLPMDDEKKKKYQSLINVQKLFNTNLKSHNKNGGIIFLDEINKAHPDMRHALFQFLISGKIHTYKIPDNYIIISAGNPFSEDSNNYENYNFDYALLNRFSIVKFNPSKNEIFNHLKTKYKDDSAFSNSMDILNWTKLNSEQLSSGNERELHSIESRMVFSGRKLEQTMVLYSEVSKLDDSNFVNKCLNTMMSSDKVFSYITHKNAIADLPIENIIAKDDKEMALRTSEFIDGKSIIKTELKSPIKMFQEISAKNTFIGPLSKFCDELCRIFKDYRVGSPNQEVLDIMYKFKLTEKEIVENFAWIIDVLGENKRFELVMLIPSTIDFVQHSLEDIDKNEYEKQLNESIIYQNCVLSSFRKYLIRLQELQNMNANYIIALKNGT